MKTWLEILDKIGDTPEHREITLKKCLEKCEEDPGEDLSEDTLGLFAHIRAIDSRLWLSEISPTLKFWPKEEREQLYRLLDTIEPIKQQLHTDEIADLEHLSDVETEDVDWLWWPYLARGTVAMLDGDPGVGKSLFTVQLAAIITRGYPLPDQQGNLNQPTESGNVLLLAAEDSARFTIRPRFDTAGGDVSKVVLLRGIIKETKEKEAFNLQHMPVLLQALEKIRPTLVVIDPIQAYLGDIDYHRANETRPLMTALGNAAEKFKACIVCVRHPAKPGAGTGKVLLRGLGSVDIIGAARTGLFIEEHPIERTKALIMQSKSNLGPKGRSMIFSRDQGQFEWCGITRADAETLCGVNRGPDPLAMLECMFALESLLQSGIPQPSADIEAQLEGHNYKTIQRARQKLGVKARKKGDVWYISLPSLEIIPPPSSRPSSLSSSTRDTRGTSPSLTNIETYGQESQIEQEGQKTQEGLESQVVPPRARGGGKDDTDTGDQGWENYVDPNF